MKLKQKVGLWVLKYLRYFAKLKLKQIKPEIIGITGSAGKTGCLKAVTTVLQDKFPTKSSLKANSESGIPLNILGIRPGNFSVFDWLRMIMLAPIKYLFNQDKYEKYVEEMGIDSAKSPKNMAYLLTIIKPQIAVWLNVLPVHTVNFPEGIDGIAREKGKLLESLPPNGYAVINRDDELIRPFLLKTKAKIIGISLKADNWQDHPEDISLTGWQLTDRSTVFSFYQSNREVTIKLAGWHPQELGLSLAAGLAVGVIEGLDFEESANGLTKNFSQEPGRSSLIEGKNGSLIIDSSYRNSLEKETSNSGGYE